MHVSLPLLRAEIICCTELQRWLLMAVTLERLSFADGLVLARTWSPTVSRQPELITLLVVVVVAVLSS